MQAKRTDSAHRVQFYNDHGYLTQRVVAHFETALVTGGIAILIGRATTIAAVDDALRARGVAVEEAVRTGRFIRRDAQEMLGQVVVDGALDPGLFRAVVVATITRAAEAHPGAAIHAYGEMVDLLWAEDRIEAMLRLEDLWTAACRETGTSLLCGYRLDRLADPHQVATLDLICAGHDSVAPAPMGHSVGNLVRRTLTLEHEVARRRHVERRMQQLLELTGELAAARTRDEVIALALDKGMRAVGAVALSLWQRVGDQLEMLGTSSSFGGAAEGYRTMRLDAGTPLTDSVVTGEPVFLGSPGEYELRYPASYARVAPMLPFRDFAFALVPMIATAPIGAVCFTYDHLREFAPPDRAFKAIVARQCAVALERIEHQAHERRLRETAEAARREIELLYELTAQVNRLDDVSEVCELALRSVEYGVGCERSAISLVDPDGKMRFKAHHGLSAAYRAAVDGHSPWRPDARDPEPVVVDDTETDPAWLSYRDVFRAERIRAFAFVPLVHHHKLVGKLMLYRETPRPFSPRDLQLAANAATHVAFAVERTAAEHALARAFSEERAAHLEAEEATRAREEILSVVSHDLRNPLGTILIGASTLLQTEANDRNRVRNVAGRIHRQAERMARLIDDLVDFAAIRAGRVSLARGLHPPTTILDATTDMFGQLATERGLQFAIDAAPNLPFVECDSERAVQVLSNLVANALKVTPRGGTISIGAEPKDRDVVFFVRDTGPGIEPDDLPRLFVRFWRGKSSRYKGTGLGLSIARGLVDAHGGRIWAESELGKGATFYFSLSS